MSSGCYCQYTQSTRLIMRAYKKINFECIIIVDVYIECLERVLVRIMWSVKKNNIIPYAIVSTSKVLNQIQSTPNLIILFLNYLKAVSTFCVKFLVFGNFGILVFIRCFCFCRFLSLDDGDSRVILGSKKVISSKASSLIISNYSHYF